MALFLVTGGAGFIGSHLVEELARRGERVRVFDNFSTGKEENLNALVISKESRSNIEIDRGDIRDKDAVRLAMRGVEYVLHQAALPSVARSVSDPLSTNDVNVTGTLNLLLAARDEKVKRFVYASSSSVYGDTPTLPKDEGMQAQPLSPYAVSKLAGERYCISFHNVYQLPAVCIRYFNVFGPRQDPASQYSAVIPKFITAMLRGERPIIHGDGLQSRDFTYVANVVSANLLSCFREKAVGNVLNVACGTRYTLLALHGALKKLIKTDVEPVFTDERKGDVKHSLASIKRAEELLGYSPLISWEEGLVATVEWYRKPQ